MSSFYNISFLLLGLLAMAFGQEQLLMVFGGDYNPNAKDVTLLSLDGGPQVPECLKDLNAHPKSLSGSCPATLGAGKILRKFTCK